MVNTNTRVEDLLNSLVGCDFLVTLVETGLSPEDLADPKVSLRSAASAADSVDRFRADHDLIAAELPALTREKEAQARAVMEHPGIAWWFDDIDLQAQAWVSGQAPRRGVKDRHPVDVAQAAADCVSGTSGRASCFAAAPGVR